MREIVHCQFGQCGNQIGTQVCVIQKFVYEFLICYSQRGQFVSHPRFCNTCAILGIRDAQKLKKEIFLF